MKYQKRPVVIEAEQWDGTAEDATRIIDWMLYHGGTARYHDDPIDYGHDVMPGDVIERNIGISINTLEGTITASPGDYIIRGVKGEFYPCKPDIFAETYEQAVG